MLKNILPGAALILFGCLPMRLAVKGTKHTRFSDDRFRRGLKFLWGTVCVAIGIPAIRLAKELE